MEVVWTPSWVHSALLIIMIMLILTGRRSGVYEKRRTSKLEREGLRAALLAELNALRAVYRLNMELMAAGAPTIMSARAYFSVYRGNMQRMMGMAPAEIASVVTAHAACELLDAAIQVGNRMRAQPQEAGGWQLRRFDLKRLHRAARASAEEAVAVLEQAAREAAAEAALSWQDRLRAAFARVWARMRGVRPAWRQPGSALVVPGAAE